MASTQAVDLAYNYIEPPNHLSKKAPIIFLHGVTSSKEFWNDIPNEVANATRRKVYIVDARNHGDSPWTDEFNFDVNVDDLFKFMDTINAPSAVIVGHSMGGITAIKAALRAPHRIEKIVVEDMNVRKAPQDRLNIIVMYLTLAMKVIQHVPPTYTEDEARKFIVEAVHKAIPPEMVALHKIPEPDPSTSRIQLKRDANGAYAYKSNVPVIIKALKDASSLIGDFSGVYEGPSTFIYGTLSPVNVGSDEEEVKKYFPHAEFVPIEGATHLTHTDKPKEFTDAMLEFLLRE